MQFKNTFLSLASIIGIVTADAWSVKKFTRNCTNPKICTYYFTIDTGVSTQHCTTVDYGNPATTHSWYDNKCQENPNYHISWGWSADQKFTVMTVVFKPNETEAFFGYNDPNAVNPIAAYPDVGPNTVQSTGVKPVAVAVAGAF